MLLQALHGSDKAAHAGRRALAQTRRSVSHLRRELALDLGLRRNLGAFDGVEARSDLT